MVETAVPESPVARTFINAFTADDQTALTASASRRTSSSAPPATAPTSRASTPPVHLGSYLAGGFTLHAYAAHVVSQDGTEVTLGWRVATGGGEIVFITPPGTIEAP